MNMKYTCAYAAILTAWGCNSEPESASVDPAAGYVHEFRCSKFRLGAVLKEGFIEYGYEKVVGSEGEFSTRISNKSVLAILNSDAPAAPLYQAGDQQHALDVKNYYVGCGLNEAQIGGLDSRVGTSGFATVLIRTIEGITVAESHAVARFNGNGTTDAEDVYWPAIPAIAISNAHRLQQLLNDSKSRDEYLAKLPTGLIQGDVVIYHTPFTNDSPFTAIGALTTQDTRTGDVRYFDVDGNEHNIPPN